MPSHVCLIKSSETDYRSASSGTPQTKKPVRGCGDRIGHTLDRAVAGDGLKGLPVRQTQGAFVFHVVGLAGDGIEGEGDVGRGAAQVEDGWGDGRGATRRAVEQRDGVHIPAGAAHADVGARAPTEPDVLASGGHGQLRDGGDEVGHGDPQPRRVFAGTGSEYASRASQAKITGLHGAGGFRLSGKITADQQWQGGS